MTDKPADTAQALHEVHEKTQAVQADIERAADQAGGIGTVLAQEVPAAVQVGDVAAAIEQTGALEQKLADSAEALAEVTAELEKLKEAHGDSAGGH